MRAPDEIIIVHRDGKPYLRRWFLRKRRVGRGNIYLHHIKRSDDPRALHDHPWNNLSIVLKGGYLEHVFAYPPVEGRPLPPIIVKRRRAGSIVFRRAEQAHRLELYGVPGYMDVKALKWHPPHEKACWSLFITWPKRREWGFWCQQRGVVGETEYPTPEGRAVILQTFGPVARWVHQQIFTNFGGCL